MPQTRQLAIEVPHEKVAEFCRKWGIRKLSFFGSVTRDDFDPARSDVDVVVAFRDGRKPTWQRFDEAAAELSAMFGRKVDVLTFDGLTRFMTREIANESVPEYDEAE